MIDFIRMGLLELCGSRVELELQNVKFLPTVGFEPGTSCLLSERATTELRRLISTEWIKVHLVFTCAIFSSPEPKAQVSYCHSAPSVRPSVVVVRRP